MHILVISLAAAFLLLGALAFYPNVLEFGTIKLAAYWTVLPEEGKWGIWFGIIKSGPFIMIHLLLFTVIVRWDDV